LLPIIWEKISKKNPDWTFDIVGDITPRTDLTVVMTRANGEVVKFQVLCRLDTSAEVDVYKNGGILQKFAKDVIASSKK
jgi:aconitate hydratase